MLKRTMLLLAALALGCAPPLATPGSRWPSRVRPADESRPRWSWTLPLGTRDGHSVFDLRMAGAADGDAVVLLTLYHRDPLRIGDLELPAREEADVVVLRLSRDGALRWVRHLGWHDWWSNGNALGWQLAVGSDGVAESIVLAGAFAHDAQIGGRQHHKQHRPGGVVLTRLHADGSVAWSRSYAGDSPVELGQLRLAVGPDGSIALAAEGYGAPVLGGGALGPAPGVLVCLTPQGEPRWSTEVGEGSPFDPGVGIGSVGFTPDGDVLLTGAHTAAYPLGFGEAQQPVVLPSATTARGFVARYGRDEGRVEWAWQSTAQGWTGRPSVSPLPGGGLALSMGVRPDASDIGYTLLTHLESGGAVVGEQRIHGPRVLVALEPGPRPAAGLALVHRQGLCSVSLLTEDDPGACLARTRDLSPYGVFASAGQVVLGTLAEPYQVARLRGEPPVQAEDWPQQELLHVAAFTAPR